MTQKTSTKGKDPFRVELNFLKLPLFTFNKEWVGRKEPFEILFQEHKRHDGVTSSYKLMPDPDLGIGGVFDFSAFRAVERQLTTEYKRFGKNMSARVEFESPYSLLRLMGKKAPTGDDYDRLKIFFHRMQHLRIESDESVYDRALDRWIEMHEKVPPIYENVEIEDELSKVVLTLGELYHSNLQAKHVKLLDYNFYRSMKNRLARKLFELISIRAFKHDEAVYYNYTDLTYRLLINRMQFQSQAEQQMKPPLEKLKELKVLESQVRFERNAKPWYYGGLEQQSNLYGTGMQSDDWRLVLPINEDFNERIQVSTDEFNTDVEAYKDPYKW